jgi:hypothetical protein
MIKPKILKDGKMAEEREEQATAKPKGHLRHPLGQIQKGRADIREHEN